MAFELLLKQLVAVVDERTTIVCLDAAGQIQSVDTPYDTLNGSYDEPPFHVNCRSVSVPWMPGFVDDQRDLANEQLQNRPQEDIRKGPDGYEGPLPPEPPVTPEPPPPPPPRIVPPDRVSDLRGGSASEHLVEHADGSVTFTPERQALHDQIVRDALTGKTSMENPTFHMLGGGPAAGKTTLINSGLAPELHQAANSGVLIANDDIKVMFPEYAQMSKTSPELAAPFVHEEAAYVTSLIRDGAMENRYDIVLDGTGDSRFEAVVAKIEQARAAGYSVVGDYVTVPTQEAVERAVRRGEATGRFLPETVTRLTHMNVSKMFEQVAPLFDHVSVYDTMGDVKMIYRESGGVKDVLDQKLWQEFLAKGAEKIPGVDAMSGREAGNAFLEQTIATKSEFRGVSSTITGPRWYWKQDPSELVQFFMTTEETIGDLVVKFPEGMKELGHVVFDRTTSQSAFADYTPASKQIRLNPVTIKSMVAHDAKSAELRDLGWFAHADSATSGLRYTITHEVGHHLDHELETNDPGAWQHMWLQIGRVFERSVTEKTGPLIGAGSGASVMWRYVTNPKVLDQFGKELVSQYAVKNKREFIAEAFSEYMNSSNPREIATIVGKAFLSAYRGN